MLYSAHACTVWGLGAFSWKLYAIVSLIVSAANPTELELFHHVACNLGDDWKHFAIYLGFESKQIQQADKEKSSKDKAYDILVAWLKGTGNEPKTWATILAALKSTELTDLAHKIQRDIEQGALYRGSLLTGELCI